jgi:ferredoxin--NADP+ reductase
MADWLKANVVEKTQWNERLFSLRMQPGLSDFIAGQFVRVGIDVDGERIARPYSLVSKPGDDSLEIYFNIVPEGPLTSHLAGLEAGDEIFVTAKANGFLTIDEVPQSRHLWLLATGTGVGPFLSILKTQQPWQRFEKIVLAYSARSISELCYQQLISELQLQNPQQFIYAPFVTREAMTGAIQQRIPQSIEDGSLEQQTGLIINEKDSHVMMCGNSEMISSVTECLEKRGMRKHRRREPGHITTEKYY